MGWGSFHNGGCARCRIAVALRISYCAEVFLLLTHMLREVLSLFLELLGVRGLGGQLSSSNTEDCLRVLDVFQQVDGGDFGGQLCACCCRCSTVRGCQ